MTLREMSADYRISARLLSDRLRILRRQARAKAAVERQGRHADLLTRAIRQYQRRKR